MLLDRADGALQGAFLNHSTAWTRIADSPDGRWRATTSGDGLISIWTTDGPAGPLAQSDAAPPPVDKAVLAAHPTGATVARDGGAGAAYVTPDGERRILSGHRGKVTAAAIEKGGEVVATGGADGRVIIRNAANGAALGVIDVGCGAVLDTFFAKGGAALLARCDEGETHVFDVKERRRLLKLPTGDAERMTLLEDESGLLMATSEGVFSWALQP